MQDIFLNMGKQKVTRYLLYNIGKRRDSGKGQTKDVTIIDIMHSSLYSLHYCCTINLYV